jgi:hypothetical protein
MPSCTAKDFVGPQPEFGAGGRGGLRAVIQGECADAGQHLLGISRQIEADHLRRDIGRDAGQRHREAIATFETSRKGLGAETRLQHVGAGNGHGAVGGDVLPAIGQRARQVRRADILSAEHTGLEQVRIAVAQRAGNRETGAPPASAKPISAFGETL